MLPGSGSPGDGDPGDEDPGEALSPSFFRALLEHAPAMMTVMDGDGVIRYATPAALELLGPAPQERVDRSFLSNADPDDAARYREELGVLLERPGSTLETELRIRDREGGHSVVRVQARNILDDPRVSGILAYLTDMTPLRAAERECEEARRLLERVITHAPILLFMLGRDGRIELLDGRGLEPLGLEPGGLVGRSFLDLYDETELGAGLIQRGLAGEEVEGETPIGDLIYHTMITPILGPDGAVEGVLGVAFDVTERERQARAAEFRARLLEAVGEAVIATDPRGVVNFWNPAAEKIYGWSVEEAMGRNLQDLTDPRPLDPGLEALDLQNPPDRWAGECDVRRKDGRRIPVHVTMVAVEEEGQPLSLVGVSTDVSETRELEAQLRQAQKMEAVGRLAGGIAHDFNNLLTAIGGYAAVAADAAENEQLAADIGEVLSATERARRLVDKLLAFSRRSQAAPQPVDLNTVIEGMVGVLRRTIGQRVRLETELARDLWPARTDPAQIEQVIVNLAVNAREAMPEGGTLTIRTDRVVLTEALARRVREGMKAGDYVRLTVSDTGVGIEPDIRERIFEPFFTTKEVGGGSGLGLSIVFGEVTRVGGGVSVRSAPREGTTFSLYLPASGAAVPRAPGPRLDDAGAAERPGETILLVEDEASVRTLARRVLEREGYVVVEADSGVAAERLLQSGQEMPGLLLTDVIMPEMGGAELAERLLASHPQLRVLYMSGYTADELRSRGLDEGADNFLPKPFTPFQLRDAVRRALSA